MKNIVLIGFMGTGKSTVGRRLAHRLKRKFVDSDEEIESVNGKTVAQIVARDGMARFRSEEMLMAKKLAGRSGLVIATGGGMVLNPENVRLLRENGVFIGLTAQPEVIFNRVKRKKTRPLLLMGNMREQIDKLFAERRDAYQIAEYTVDTSVLSQEEVVEVIVRYLKERQEL